MGNYPHYFIAIPLPETIQEQFAEWQSQLMKHIPLKRWYDKRDFHITLKFLGPVSDNQLTDLSRGLSGLELHAPFSLRVGKVGTFGSRKHPRVVWAGVEESEPLFLLKQTVENVTEMAGFPKENRPYRPHITLGKRWDNTNSKDMTEILASIQEPYRDIFTMEVAKAVLYQVEPEKKQKYKPVHTYSLLGKE